MTHASDSVAVTSAGTPKTTGPTTTVVSQAVSPKTAGPKDTVTLKTTAAKLQAQKARDDLADTLDALEGKLNLPKNAAAAYRRNPLPFIVGGVVVIGAIVGVVIWAIVRDD